MLLILIAMLSTSAHAGKVRLSASASDSLSTSYSCEVVSDVTATDSNARPIPGQGYALRVEMTLTSIVTATQIVSLISKSADPDDAITQEATTTIVDDGGDGDGKANEPVNNGWVLDDDATDKQGLFVCAKTNAGTATVVHRLIWEQK